MPVTGRFGPEALGLFSLGRFGLSCFGPGSFWPILVGCFGLIFSSPMAATYGEINIYEANRIEQWA